MPMVSSFKSIDNEDDIERGKGCLKTFCKSLREHAMKKINFINKAMKLLTNEQ